MTRKDEKKVVDRYPIMFAINRDFGAGSFTMI